ncbi:MAG: cyclic nucleotide-binding domain-containing protein [Spirochaetes bacterium]|nr:cyclic nucleotide-binding domain-containing protein [Spirochaetota bacterium]
MSQDYIKLYSAASEPDCAYFLSNGVVYYYASNVDKYAIRGQNLIVGSTELIMNHIFSEKTCRIETAVALKDSSIKKIPADKFFSSINSFSFLVNASIVLAKQVLLTNKIINKNLDLLDGRDRQIKEYSIKYYCAVNMLSQEYEKRKLPWINDIVKKHAGSLNFKRGEAFFKAQDSITVETTSVLSDRMIEYPRGSVICEENTTGEEMYILQTGSIDVEIGGNRVATIDRAGTVFGEMAILLNEKRTATLRAKNNAVITVIKKSELRDAYEKQSDILKNITFSLARRHYYNLIKISSVNKSLIDQTLDSDEGDDKKAIQLEKLKIELGKFRNELSDAQFKRKAEFLQTVIDECG